MKIDRVEAIDEMDKLCKFQENPTKNIDLYFQKKKRKRLTDGQTDGQVDDGNHAMT